MATVTANASWHKRLTRSEVHRCHKGAGEKRHLAAKKGSAHQDIFPKDYVLECLEQSLRNLQRDEIDSFRFHVWNDDWSPDPEWAETPRELQSSGKVRFIGISINDP